MTTGEDVTTHYDLSRSPSHLLHRAQQYAANLSSTSLKSAGITLRQFSVLAAVANEEGASQSRLVEATGIDRSTLADMVSRMETAGLILRESSDADKRAKAVSLTDAGREALGAAAPAVIEADAALMTALPKNRRDAFLAILSVLVTDPTTDKAAEKPKKAATADSGEPDAPAKPKKKKPSKKAKKKKAKKKA